LLSSLVSSQLHPSRSRTCRVVAWPSPCCISHNLMVSKAFKASAVRIFSISISHSSTSSTVLLRTSADALERRGAQDIVLQRACAEASAPKRRRRWSDFAETNQCASPTLLLNCTSIPAYAFSGSQARIRTLLEYLHVKLTNSL
jgi:hypothetical protein